MSHFTVAVLMNEDTNLEDIMAPYQEQYGEFYEYTEFCDETEEYKKEYENGTVSVFKASFGYVPESTISRFPDKSGKSRYDRFMDECGNPIEMKNTDLWKTFEDYCSYMEYESHDGKWGYWDNPQGYWDYWGEIDPSNYWENKTNTRPTVEEVISKAAKEEHKEYFSQLYNKIIANERATQENAPEPYDLDIHEVWSYKRKALSAKDESEFVEKMTIWTPYALITPDGVWHAAGTMGWFGMSSDTGREALNWVDECQKILSEHKDCSIAVLDCHI